MIPAVQRCQEDNDRVIAALARENVALRDEVAELKESARRRSEWLDEAKRAAGFSSNTSFDDVWAKCLAAYKISQDSKDSP
jgi:hypothetical protein